MLGMSKLNSEDLVRCVLIVVALALLAYLVYNYLNEQQTANQNNVVVPNNNNNNNVVVESFDDHEDVNEALVDEPEQREEFFKLWR
jgi:lipopolysaccharide export system protein LptC